MNLRSLLATLSATALAACGGASVTPNTAPTSAITAPAGASVTIDAGESVSFSATCTDAEGDALTHLWTFGGGAADSAQQNPGNVTFTEPGNFVATYTCTDSKGLHEATPPTRIIHVLAPVNHAPDGSIVAPAADASISQGDSVTFQGACSDADGDTVTHAWTFGGGAPASAMQNPGAVTFATAGTFTVTYTCTDSHGLLDPTPATRTVTVAAVVANQAPDGVISAPASSVSLQAGNSVAFAATCSDPDGDTVTHAWDFGGGAAASTDQNPGNVTFATAGTFTVTYTCTDSHGLADPTPDTRTITVTPVPVNQAPDGVISTPAAGVSIQAGASVAFAATCTDPEGDAVTHAWDFGGAAAASTAQNPGNVTFANAGTFTVTYTCTDSHGLSDPTPDTRVITVTAAGANQPPDGTITAPAANATILVGDAVSFSAACVDPDGDTVTHAWTFGGGAADSTAQNPGSVTFATAGTFTVTYTCTDSHGFADPSPATRTVTVNPPNRAPDGAISSPAADATITAGGSVTFASTCTDPDGDAVTHAWSFGGGAAASTAQNPGAVTFATAGTFAVTYTCTDSHGLADPTPATRTVTVSAAPANRTLTGKVTFDKVVSTADGLDYAAATKKPVRNAELAVVEAANLANVLATSFTAEDGTYSVSWPASGPSSVRVIVYSRTHAPKMIVEDNTSSNAVYALSSANVDATATSTVDLNAAHGWNGTAYVTRAASPFTVLDTLWQAVQLFRTARPDVIFPDLHANWSENNAPVDPLDGETQDEAYAAGRITTSHWNGEELYLLGQADVDTDEFDDHVVAHEWGHYFETYLSRADSPGGPHGYGDLKDARLAFSEGWGNALSAMVWFPNAVYTDTYDPGQASGFYIDMDDNSASEDPNPGWYSEASVEAILYDLFDSGTTESTYDNVALGIGPIYDVLTTAQKNTQAFTTLFSFIRALKTSNAGSADAIDTLTRYRGVVGVPIADAYGTGETNSGGNALNLPVYRSISVGTAVSLTMVGANGDGNELGQNRWLRFTGDGQSHTVSITTGNTAYDVDVIVTQAGDEKVWADGLSGTETTPSFKFESGFEYIIWVEGWGRGTTSTASYTTSVKIN